MSTHPEIMYAERSSADEPEKVGDGAVIDLAGCPSRMMRPARAGQQEGGIMAKERKESIWDIY